VNAATFMALSLITLVIALMITTYDLYGRDAWMIASILAGFALVLMFYVMVEGPLRANAIMKKRRNINITNREATVHILNPVNEKRS
jgi:hypothetical protein